MARPAEFGQANFATIQKTATGMITETRDWQALDIPKGRLGPASQ